MRDRLKAYGPMAAVLALLIGVVFVLLRYVEPAPPRSVRIATGSEQGAYAEFGKRYGKILARDGLGLEVLTTAGSVENLRLLTTPRGGADVAFLQGGIAPAGTASDLVAIASLFVEPVWLFARADLRVEHLRDLRGRRIAVGAEGSGTRAVALQLLEANGIMGAPAELLPLGWRDAVEALIARKIDAAFFVTARPMPALEPLLRASSVQLVSFPQAEAYARRFRFLSKVSLPEGTLDFAANIPPRDVTLVAPVATLVARESLHPSLIERLLRAAREVHAPGGIFEDPGQFPSPKWVDFPLSDEADRQFKSGPSFLSRYLPFWAAVMVERLLVTLVPVIAIVITVVRQAPTILGWRVRQKILRWYGELQTIERQARTATTPAEQERVERDLRQVERGVGELSVALGYMESLYELRRNVQLAAQRLSLGRETAGTQAG